MKCADCEFENQEGAKFCIECGARLLLDCPRCGKAFLISAKFCDECGVGLGEPRGPEHRVPAAEGERKHVTVLFSDLSGYTAMTEQLDPEDVKEMLTRIFAGIAQVIAKYQGFMERPIGDAAMAVFGVPHAHEDDPVRAVKAAMEIHDLVATLSPEFEHKTGRPLTMHSGINTGLVVTGEVDLEQGTHGLTGDAINTASRIQGLAKAGEILVGYETYLQTEGYFEFEQPEASNLKGKADPVSVYRLISPKEQPVHVHRLSGLKADLIGRKVEMSQLHEAVEKLREGKRSVFSICGDAGTGKSRLIEEFKNTIDLEDVQWIEGHAYAYAQNIPYFPLVDLLNRAFQIKEGDPPPVVKSKVESAIKNLVGKDENCTPYVGSLYALSYPEIEAVSPEFWKLRLQEAIHTLLSALIQERPTVLLFEDLHWADPSFVELLRSSLLGVRKPAIFLCVYRPPFSLFTAHQSQEVSPHYHEVSLQDLSTSEAQDMVESLLKCDSIPSELQRFIQRKVEGNPFYLEEAVNSLVEGGTLRRENGTWELSRPITEADISSTVHGVIAARLDRLGRDSKQILQEASVIGRVFPHELLRSVTDLKRQCDPCLSGLERDDLIRTRTLQPEREYIFKHALTQEVAYNGILKKTRRDTHERIARVMETLFHDRLPDFYETLAFHFKRGECADKAVHYLMKAGDKSLRKYSVEEAHDSYQQAFRLLSDARDKSTKDEGLLIDLLIKWALVFYYRGNFRGLTELFASHEPLAKSLKDPQRLGMFRAWHGFGLYGEHQLSESYKYLREALAIGEELEDCRIIGYACTWLTFTCANSLRLDEALSHGRRALEIAAETESDPYLYFKSLWGLADYYRAKGGSKELLTIGSEVLEYGTMRGNIRSMTCGHLIKGYGHYAAGDYDTAIASSERAVQVSADPFYSNCAGLLLGGIRLLNGEFEEAQRTLGGVASWSDEAGCRILSDWAHGLVALAFAATGQAMDENMKALRRLQKKWSKNGCSLVAAFGDLLLGQAYLGMVAPTEGMSPALVLKNLVYLIKTLPFASKKAEEHLGKVVEVARETGASGLLGEAYLGLGLLYTHKHGRDEAKECLTEAIEIFEHNGANALLEKAREALASLGEIRASTTA